MNDDRLEARLALNSHCVLASFAGDVALFVLADGSVHGWAAGHHWQHQAHDGVLAAVAARGGNGVLSAGEDGRVCLTPPGGTPQELACQPRRWLDAIATSASGAVAFSSGRNVWVRDPQGRETRYEHARSVGGIDFSPDGNLLGVARYEGLSLHPLTVAAEPTHLSWKGIPTGLTFSPDGRFVVVAVQENSIHGWRLADGQHMTMTTYPARVRDWSWSSDGRWLATAGAPAAIVWPFDGDAGPIGRTAVALAARDDRRVTAVRCHPSEAVVAVGYDDGMLMAARIDSDDEVEVRPPGGGAIMSIAWSAQGTRLAYGDDAGGCAVLRVARRRLVQ